MSIPTSPEVSVLLLVLFIGYMLYANREGIKTRSTQVAKTLYAGVVLAEVGMIVGSRFVVPPVLGEVIESANCVTGSRDWCRSEWFCASVFLYFRVPGLMIVV